MKIRFQKFLTRFKKMHLHISIPAFLILGTHVVSIHGFSITISKLIVLTVYIVLIAILTILLEEI